MSIILAEAAGIHEGKFVAQTQSYGPETWGGVSKAEVIISDEDIDYPRAMNPDLLLAMNQKSCDENYRDLKQGGTLIVDSTFVHQAPTPRAFSIPFTRIAREECKQAMAANIVALGTLIELVPIVSRKSVEAALLARVPRGTEKLNRDALKAGIREAKRAKKTRKEMKVVPEIPEEELQDAY